MGSFLYSLQLTFIFIIVPALCVLAIRQLSYWANEKLVNIFGFNSQIYVGGLGVVIHELSHLLLALIFLHHIDSVCLLRIPNKNDPSDTSMGYVRHSWSTSSIYQTVGNVFIGVAPVICGILIIFLILNKLQSPLTSVHQQITDQILSNGIGLSFVNQLGSYVIQAFQIHLTSLPVTILQLLLITSLCFGGFDLSDADLHATRFAFVILLILGFMTGILIGVLNLQSIFLPSLVNFGVWLYLLFAISILVLLVLNLIMFILKMLV